MKKQSGITLVALVITIIVLLILAGVSISLVVGNSGVLTQASSAVIANREAKAKEEIAMAWSSATTKYWADWVNDSTKTLDDYLTKASLDQYLTNGTLVEDPTYADGLYTVKYQSEGAVYTILVDGRGNTTLSGTTLGEGGGAGGNSTPAGTTSSSVATAPTTYYGKTVNYSVNGITDWKIFYADSTNIYLILSDYLPKEKVPAAIGAVTEGVSGIHWSSAPTAQAINSTTCPYGFLWHDATEYVSAWTDYSTYAGGRCVSTLLNTNNWTDFVNTTYADYAIGSPTLAMYIASWNAKGYTTLYADNTNEYGYYVGIASTPTEAYKPMGGEGDSTEGTGYYDSLYYPRRTYEYSQNGNGYWLASPSALGGDVVMIYFDGDINNTPYGNNKAIRPIVRLKNTTTLVEGTNGYDYDLSAN